MSLDLPRARSSDPHVSARREWLATTGLGGYALGPVSGPRTRCSHALLVAALDPPLGRTLLVAVAFQAALDLGVSPEAMLMAIAVAASTAFATPVASPVNALVLTPGRYRFGDFAKVGLPIVLLMLVATLLVVPTVFPLHP